MNRPSTSRSFNILLVSNDQKDIDIIKNSFLEYNNEIRFYSVSDKGKTSDLIKIFTQDDDLIIFDLVLITSSEDSIINWDLLKKFKQDNHFKYIPVIILSHSNNEQDVLEAYENYASCYISIPESKLDYKLIIKKLCHFWLETVKLPHLMHIIN
jgi:CheY-like chemotaxis protein